MAHRVLLIGDNQFPLAAILADGGFEAEVVSCRACDWSVASREQRPSSWDLFVATLFESTPQWANLFQSIASHTTRPPVLAVLREGTAAQLFRGVARSADDFIVWSAERQAELRERVARLLGKGENAQSISERLTDSVAISRLVGQDARFVDAIAKIPVVARSRVPVLIQGETGTGKELCARAVHHMSPRRHFPFIPVDCAALPDHLLENELFGHVRGAFTDAHRDQAGLVAMAEGGTLFLDEINSLPLPVQAKLLRLIAEHTYKPLGANRFAAANIRIVAAGNRSLDEMVRQQRFRSDLFFRLNVLQLYLPALRHRRGDIPLLARHFVERACGEAGTGRKTLVPAALDALVRAEWPGNVRELYNVIQRAVVFCDGPAILPHHISLSGEPPADSPDEDTGGGFRAARERTVRAFERAYIEELLRKHHGNVTRSAAEARKDRRVFGRMMKRYHIDRVVFETH